MKRFVGRKKERQKLDALLHSGRSEFVAVYGRRRVGKTFMIRETFENNFHFSVTGLAEATLSQQLTNFHFALKKYGSPADLPPTDWLSAFHELSTLLESSDATKKVVFIDELPWMDTAKSGFIPALEHFWNSWASARKDVFLIVCGSSASWMIHELINNQLGLHNRVTHRMKVEPFRLNECAEFFASRGFAFNRFQMVELYMALGGIPFYMESLETGLSAAQNIDKLCFSENGLLRNEFHRLYASLFKGHEKHIALVKALSSKNMGLTRKELIEKSGLPNGGGTTDILQELEESGFIKRYTPFKKKYRESLYQLNDFYSLFYFQFIEGKTQTEGYWQSIYDSPKHRSWSGYAFEQVCLNHLPQIKRALGISGVQTEISSWRSKTSEPGAQIDLLIERKDQVINLCEIKFSIHPFTIDKTYEQALRTKVGTFKEETGTKYAVFLTMITSFGLNQNQHSQGLVQNTLSMEDLFEPAT